MIASWMAYSFAVAVLVAAAAFSLEIWSQTRGLPIRWIWIGALATAVALPLVVMVGIPGDSVIARTGVGEILVVEAGPMVGGVEVASAAWMEAIAARLDPLLGVIWLAGSALVALIGVVSFVVLVRRERRWSERVLNGRRVKVSANAGPAVVGFVRCRIVVPEWAVDASEETQRLIIAHEEEHIRVRDPQMLLASYLFLVALPWNLPLWWIVHRLRLAIEIDCDARVLARGANVRAYGSLLVDASGSGSGFGYGLSPALSNPARFLERRIRVITRKADSKTRWTAVLAVATSAVLLLAACELDQPPSPLSMGGDEPSEADTVALNTPVVRPPVQFELPPPPPPADERDQTGPPPPAPAPQPAGQGASVPAGGEAAERRALPVITTESELPDLAREPAFTPMEVRPELRNRARFVQELQERYPPAMRDAGIGGTLNVWIYIDEEGRVRSSQVQQSSGYPQLDQVAESLMLEVAEFSPASNRGENVPVWISIPVTFETRR